MWWAVRDGWCGSWDVWLVLGVLYRVVHTWLCSMCECWRVVDSVWRVVKMMSVWMWAVR